MAPLDAVVPLILEGRTQELAEALLDLPGYALAGLPAGSLGPALDCLAAAGRLDEALTLYQSAHAVQAPVPLPLPLARALIAQDQSGAARDLLAGWRDGARKRPGEFLSQANVLEDAFDVKAALPVLDTAVRAFPQSGTLALHHARLLLLNGDAAAALDELERGLEADPIQPPLAHGLRAVLSGRPAQIGPLTLDLPLDLLGPETVLAVLNRTHRLAARTAALAGLASGAQIHDAAAGAGDLALALALAAPGAVVTAETPDGPLAALTRANIAANGRATYGRPTGPAILIAALADAAPAIPASVTRLIAEIAPGLAAGTLTSHLRDLFAEGFVLNAAASGPALITLDRAA